MATNPGSAFLNAGHNSLTAHPVNSSRCTNRVLPFPTGFNSKM